MFFKFKFSKVLLTLFKNVFLQLKFFTKLSKLKLTRPLYPLKSCELLRSNRQFPLENVSFSAHVPQGTPTSLENALTYQIMRENYLLC